VRNTIDAGLGAFLQHVEVEPHPVERQFAGFSIVALRPAAYWKGVDLRPGDIVKSVNRMSIERPTEAFAAFTSLRTASELRVSLVRAGAPRELVFRIVERASGSRLTQPVRVQAARGRADASAPGESGKP